MRKSYGKTAMSSLACILALAWLTAAATSNRFAPYLRAHATPSPSSTTLDWPDRRPIASLILATSATGWKTNPRGWLLDPTIDVTTAAGVKAFQTRIFRWADNSIRVMRAMGAQGMVTWDIEGEQYPHATTYIGDPRVFARLAPEMRKVADQYFARFRDAGFRVGVCIRPQQLEVNGSAVNQREVSDPTQLLMDKIAFAKQRWNTTLFYIDSNGDPNFPISVSIMRALAAAYPDVLLIPEHQNLAYYAVTAPYDELRGGVTATPWVVRKIFPSAFTIINVADGDVYHNIAALQQAVNAGDVLMFRGWFDDPVNAKVKSIYSSGSLAIRR